jgi:hypothetical protein
LPSSAASDEVGKARKAKPIFETSLNIPIAFYAIMTVVLLSIGLWLVLISPPDAAAFDGALTALLILLVLYPLRKLLRMQVRVARFYEDHFVLSGKGGRRDFPYAELWHVEETERGSILSPAQMKLYLRSEPNPLLVIGNPGSRLPGTRLVSWLQGKLQP